MHDLNFTRRRLVFEDEFSRGPSVLDKRHPHRHYTFGLSATTLGAIALGTTAAAGVASAVIQSDASRKSLHAQQDALKSQQEIAANLKYEPIDLEKLKTDAAAQAVQNATASLALERSLQPNVSATREGLAKTVNEQLALGGKLSPDVANQVAQAGRIAGSASGVGGTTAPVTAALIGQTAQGLLQQRQDNATNLLAANPLPVAGLDPGALASAEVANNTAQNQFNLEKAGVSSNLVNSQAQIQSGQAGANAAQWSSILNLVQGLTSGLANRAATKTPTTTGGSLPSPSSLNFTAPTLNYGGLWG